MRDHVTLAAAMAATLVLPSLAGAQSPEGGFVACTNQQALEQVLETEGELMPEDCRAGDVATLESNGRRLCAIDLSAAGGNVIETLRDAATPTQWWIECDALTERLR